MQFRAGGGLSSTRVNVLQDESDLKKRVREQQLYIKRDYNSRQWVLS